MAVRKGANSCKLVCIDVATGSRNVTWCPRQEASNTLNFAHADVVELVDTPVLGAGAVRREGSSPFIRTNKKTRQKRVV